MSYILNRGYYSKAEAGGTPHPDTIRLDANVFGNSANGLLRAYDVNGPMRVLPNDFTVTAKVNITASNVDATLFSGGWRLATNTFGWTLRDKAGSLEAIVRNSAQANLTASFASSFGLQRVTMRWENGVGLSLFVDGVLKDNALSASFVPKDSISAGPSMVVMSDQNFTTFQLYIHDTGFWARALTDEEIAGPLQSDVYSADQLITLWDFEDGVDGATVVSSTDIISGVTLTTIDTELTYRAT